jgi:NAD(P)-dependent dehydrogenase (short-subunit alcohol dehydrogenase family)
MAEKPSLKDKVAVITGGSRGIGFAIAEALGKEGCQVVIAGRDAEALNTATGKLKAAGVESMAQTCDVGDSAQVEQLFAAVKKRHSTIDILVNNAGVAHALAPVEKVSVEDWKRVIGTNLTGMFLCTRAAVPLMRTGGTIINNLSVAAVQPFEGMAAYNASKHGALGFTNVLREELREQGIRVLALMPGPTDTAIWQQFWPEAPREKMVSVATVAEAVVHVVALPASTTIEEIRLRPTIGSLRA